MDKRDIRSNIREISRHLLKHSQPAQRPAVVVMQKMEVDSVPSQEAIARLAYETFHRRGRHDGFDQQDWFSAERQLGLKN